VQTLPLGNTGIEITEFVFGAGSIGGVGGAVATRGRGIDAAAGLGRLDEAHALGIRVVDTADSYGGGDSERTVGQWLTEHDPAGVLVQTKVGTVNRDGRSGVDLSGRHIERQLAQSIQRLGRVDLYLSHVPDPDTATEETLTAFAAAQEAGLLRAYGVCNVDVRLLESLLATAATLGLPRPQWVQNGMSLLNRADELDLLPLVQAEGLGYMAFSPLAGGVLSERYLDGVSPARGSRIEVAGDRYYRGMYSPENLTRVAALRDIAREQDISVAGLALAWLRAHPAGIVPIVAPSTEPQWEAVRDALDATIDDDLEHRVSDIFR
jgi:aryl-alcohol dehydrogenase-like predicted oxidoreductase